MTTIKHEDAKGAPVDRPVRPKRQTKAMMGTSPRDTFPYRRGASAGANKTGYNNPYKNGRDHDDYIHGYLDAIELAESIEINKRNSVTHNAELSRAAQTLNETADG